MIDGHDCAIDGCEWFVWGGEDIHTIQEKMFDDGFEAIVNAIIKCKHCGVERQLVFNAETQEMIE